MSNFCPRMYCTQLSTESSVSYLEGRERGRKEGRGEGKGRGGRGGRERRGEVRQLCCLLKYLQEFAEQVQGLPTSTVRRRTTMTELQLQQTIVFEAVQSLRAYVQTEDLVVHRNRKQSAIQFHLLDETEASKCLGCTVQPHHNPPYPSSTLWREGESE